MALYHLLLLLFLHPGLQLSVQATRFTSTFILTNDTPNNDSKSKSLIIFNENLQDTVFGISLTGRLEATFNYPPEFKDTINSDDDCIKIAIGLCTSSSDFVRSPGFERRHPPNGKQELYNTFAATICTQQSGLVDSGPCQWQDLRYAKNQYIFSAPDDVPGHEIYTVVGIVCQECASNSSSAKKVSITVHGEFHYTNPNSLFPELGYEERHFPILAAIGTAILGTMFLLSMTGLACARCINLSVPRIAILVFVACALKGLTAGLTFLYFWDVANTGIRSDWYLYVRLTLSAVADIAFIVVLMGMSSGFRILPTVWFVDGRFPVFIVYIGVTLQAVIIIAVKLMFPFRYLGVLTYTAAAGAIALVTTLASYRNLCFLRRYALLIERSHIYSKTTPVYRMQRFYFLNVIIVSSVYLCKIISLGVFDYNMNAPDLTWAGMELTDAILLSWYTIAVLPRKKSAIYVDMSNVSNERLQEADTWRATQSERADGDTLPSSQARPALRYNVWDSDSGASNSSENGQNRGDANELDSMEAGRQQAIATAPVEPHPPWISWSSGMSLPRPNASTWGGYTPVARMMRRERRLVPVLPPSIVLGTTADESDTLKLTIGMPVAGPNCVPSAFDEKGMEIARDPHESPTRVGSESSRVVEDNPASGGGETDQAFENSGRRGDIQTVLRRLRLRAASFDATRSNDGSGDSSDGHIVEPSEGNGSLPSRYEGSQAAPSVASSGASCDGVLFPAEEGLE